MWRMMKFLYYLLNLNLLNSPKCAVPMVIARPQSLQIESRDSSDNQQACLPFHNHQHDKLHDKSEFYMYIYIYIYIYISSANQMESRYCHITMAWTSQVHALAPSWALSPELSRWENIWMEVLPKSAIYSTAMEKVLIAQSILGCHIFRQKPPATWAFRNPYMVLIDPLVDHHLPYPNCDSMGILSPHTPRNLSSTKLVKYPFPEILTVIGFMLSPLSHANVPASACLSQGTHVAGRPIAVGTAGHLWTPVLQIACQPASLGRRTKGTFF